VLLIVSDDQRPDTIRALGNAVIHTPRLDALVREGTVFTRAVSPNPICVASRREILTGCSGLRRGVADFGGRLQPDQIPWPRVMREAGYHTWYVGKWHSQGRPSLWGYEESAGLFAGGGRQPAAVDHAGRPVTGYVGWVLQTEAGQTFPEQGVGLTPDLSRRLADAAIGLLQRRPQEPFFLHVNFTAPHDPLLIPPGYENRYDPARMPLPANFLPEHPFDHGNLHGRDEELFAWPRTPAEVRRELAAYYAVISHMDEQIGRLLDVLAATDQDANTLVIFTSDQGLAIGSHGLRGKQNMYEHTVGVPLVMRGPGILRGARRSAQCYLRDLYPTVLELAGIPIPENVQARSLVPVLRGQAEEVYPEISGYFGDMQRMVRTDRWKLVWYPQIRRCQLFDLPADPYELHDLAGDPAHAAIMAELQAKLAAWQTAVGDPAPRLEHGSGKR
jgi:arylsulfatase A-like enzyme